MITQDTKNFIQQILLDHFIGYSVIQGVTLAEYQMT